MTEQSGHDMDPADIGLEAHSVRKAIHHHGVTIGHHDRSLRLLSEENQALAQQVSALTAQVSALLSLHSSASTASAHPAASASPPQATPILQDSRATDPDPYSGQPSLCRGFLFQCTSVFQLKPTSFTSDTSRIQYICGLLRGRALAWAEARFSRHTFHDISYGDFV